MLIQFRLHTCETRKRIIIRWKNEHISQSVKVMTLNVILLIIARVSKQHNMMPQEVFNCNIKALGCF